MNKVKLVEWIDYPTKKLENNAYEYLTNLEEITVASMGNLTITKGQEQIEHLINVFDNKIIHGKKIKIVYVGGKIPKYENNIYSFLKLLKKYNIQGLLHLNKVGESYCYSLTKSLLSGLPILYNNIGAFKGRINKNENKFFIGVNSEDEYCNFSKLEHSFIQFIDYISTHTIQRMIPRDIEMVDNHSIIDLIKPKHFNWNNISQIVYINLDNRIDRKNHIEKELKNVGIPPNLITRLNATKHKKGLAGCAHSHYKICQMAIDNNWNNVLVFEDDFVFTIDKHTVNNMFYDLFNPLKNCDKWDGIVLAANINIISKPSTCPFLDRNLGSQTTSGYIIQKDMFYPLRDIFYKSYEDIANGKPTHEFALDISWQKLHKKYKWYIFKPKMGRQIDGYSDIEEKITDYSNVE